MKQKVTAKYEIVADLPELKKKETQKVSLFPLMMQHISSNFFSTYFRISSFAASIGSNEK